MNGDLTSGHPLKKILIFCIPMLIGNLFQQLYTVINSIIVGKFLGVEAFAAVGSTSSLHALVIGFAVGLCSGLSIPVAQHYGAGNVPALRKAESAAIYIAGIASVLISLTMLFFTDPILRLLGTPDNLHENAAAYIRTLCAGSGALILYNLVINFMRALGDSRTPLVFLILSAVLNVALDLFFVVLLGLGVTGAATATVLAQLLSALLGLRSIRKGFPVLFLDKETLRPSLKEMRRLSAAALPVGLQSSITAIGSIVMQMAINRLGAQAVAAAAVGSKVANILMAPLDAVGIGIVIFTCQNYGAGHLRRISKGVLQAMLALAAYSLVSLGILWVAGLSFARLFISSEEAEFLALVQTYLRTSGCFFCSVSVIYVYRNALQGLGWSNAAMGSGLCEMISRILVALLLLPSLGFVGVSLSSPLAWTCAALFLVPMYYFAMKQTGKKLHPPMADASKACA